MDAAGLLRRTLQVALALALAACGSRPAALPMSATPAPAPAASSVVVAAASGDGARAAAEVSTPVRGASAAAADAADFPEGASGWTPKPGWSARRFMVAAANPLATEAGYGMLKAGGSALDAAIAVQMVLALVEPQSSGIGGGAFLLHWDGRTVQAWDGRETAPAQVDERQFLNAAGRPLPFAEAVHGGRAVATPGVLRMLEAAHRQHGRLPWARLFQPAIDLAEGGFEVSPRLLAMLQGSAQLRNDPLARAYFFDAGGRPWPVGHALRNPALADVLRAIAAGGSGAFYQGSIAADLVDRVHRHPVPGSLSLNDLATYAPRLRSAICTDWLAIYRVCGFPPPSSGHLAIMQMLGLLERVSARLPETAVRAASAPAAEAKSAATNSPRGDTLLDAAFLHRYLEAARLAYADRAQFVADPDFVPAPGGNWLSLLDAGYLDQRAALIGERSMNVAPAGQPATMTIGFAAMPEQPEHGTSHISVVDGDGHGLAMTTTIEAFFGSRVMADGGTGKPGGYLLNNEMTDFSMQPADDQGRPIANRIQPGKRPRSSMSPTLVFDRRDGRLLMTLGSPGGPVIMHFTAKTLIASLQWGLDVQRAIDLPNFGSLNGPSLLERGRFPLATVEALRARGHVVREVDLTSGLQAITRTPQGWFGGADPRREGLVMGD